MAKQVAHKRDGTPIIPLDLDPSPEYACMVDPETGRVSHWIAFVPQYGPESQAQIDWWKKHGYPGADKWEVGKPIQLAPPKKALAAMATASKEGT